VQALARGPLIACGKWRCAILSIVKTVIVLAVHGMPPADFPRQELAEFFRLHAAGETTRLSSSSQERYSLLEDRMRDWPRNEGNDPFYSASQELAAHLSRASGHEVIVGYNEFCAPSIDEALQRAADRCATRIFVATTMMTRGGDHAEKDIPAAIDRFRGLHPEIEVTYAWPFDMARVAEFLSDHIQQFT